MLVIHIILVLVVLKSLIVGSDFNVALWFRHKKIYTRWYFDKERTTFTV